MRDPMEWSIEEALVILGLEGKTVQKVTSSEELKSGAVFVHRGDRYAGYNPFTAEVIAETTVNDYGSSSMKIKLHSAHADLGNVGEVIDFCVIWSEQEIGFPHNDIELERIYVLAEEEKA